MDEHEHFGGIVRRVAMVAVDATAICHGFRLENAPGPRQVGVIACYSASSSSRTMVRFSRPRMRSGTVGHRDVSQQILEFRAASVASIDAHWR